VISFGQIHGGDAFNVIPDSVALSGTVRTLVRETQARVKRDIERTVRGITEAWGARYNMSYSDGYPPMDNDADLNDLMREAVRKTLGPERLHEIPKPVMGGEDFALYARLRPAAYFNLGTGNPEKETTHVWHSPRFNIDEDALPDGAAALARAVLDYC